MWMNWVRQFSGSCLAAAVMFCGVAGESRADGDYLVEAMGNVLNAANTLESLSAFGYDADGGVCILGAFIEPGATATLRRDFRMDRNYAILAGGDSDAQDIDIRVLDSFGRQVTEDTAADACPAVTFRPRSAAVHEVRVSLPRASRASFVFVALMREGGYRVPENNQIVAAGSLLVRARACSELAPNRNARMLATNNNWAVYGCLLAGGQKMTIDNISLGHGQRVVVTGSDANDSDLDLYLKDNYSDRTREKDDAADSEPVVATIAGGGLSRLQLENARSNGAATFSLMGIVELD
ncbi:MAG: hypothetical protein RLZZ436_3956 [Planctomycetota bacterium]|jgi:hypothetical protein